MDDFEKREFVWNTLNEILDDTIVDNVDQYTLRDYISDNNIKIIDEKIVYIFQDIPNNDIRELLENLISLVIKYQDFATRLQIEAESGIAKLRKLSGEPTQPKPVEKIKKTINTIQAYQDMIERLYGMKNKKSGAFVLFNPPKEIKINYENNKFILDDLRTKQFKIIYRSRFYAMQPQSKTELKLFFETIVKKYNLENVSKDIPKFINSIEPRAIKKDKKPKSNKRG